MDSYSYSTFLVLYNVSLLQYKNGLWYEWSLEKMNLMIIFIWKINNKNNRAQGRTQDFDGGGVENHFELESKTNKLPTSHRNELNSKHTIRSYPMYLPGGGKCSPPPPAPDPQMRLSCSNYCPPKSIGS